MAEWIPLDVSYFDNPKIVDLACHLGLSEPMYAGSHHLRLLTYVFNHFKTGVIEGVNLENKIAHAAGWRGDAKLFVDSLVKVGLVHRTDDGATCDVCFPPEEDGSPRELLPGFYVVHRWMDRMEAYLYFQERKRIAREQAAKRSREKRKRQSPGNVVREAPEVPYDPAPRGLRAAPALVRQKLGEILDSVTSRKRHATRHAERHATRHALERVTSRKRHAAERVTSREPTRDAKLTNIAEPHEYTESVTSRKRHATRHALPTNLPNNLQKKPSSEEGKRHKDTPLVFSSSNGEEENPKGGILDVQNPPPTFFSFKPKPEPENDPDLARCTALWCDLFQAKVGRPYGALHRGKISRYLLRRLRHPAGPDSPAFTYAEIERRIRNWFASTWDRVTTVHEFQFSEFTKRFSDLEFGPLEQWQRKGERNGTYDKPRVLETRDDFT
jgi:hypothetical protein